MKEKEVYIKVWAWDPKAREYFPRFIKYETEAAAKETFDQLSPNVDMPQIAWGIREAGGWWKVKEWKEA